MLRKEIEEFIGFLQRRVNNLENELIKIKLSQDDLTRYCRNRETLLEDLLRQTLVCGSAKPDGSIIVRNGIVYKMNYCETVEDINGGESVPTLNATYVCVGTFEEKGKDNA